MNAISASATGNMGETRRAPFALIVAGILLAVVLGLTGEPSKSAKFAISPVDSNINLGSISLPVGVVGLICGALTVALGAYALTLLPRRMPPWILRTAFGLIAVAFLVWAAAGNSLNLSSLAEASVVGALPLLLGALAGVLCERSGVINIAIEGQFLFGAFAASVAASALGLWVGLVAGSVAGGLIGAILAYLAVRYAADQVIVGFVLNLLALGLTSFLFTQVIVPNQEAFGSPPTFSPIDIPVLSELPIVGPALFDQNVILYIAIAILVATQLMLSRSRWGLRTRAVGESPEAAQSAGIDVLRLRTRNVIAGGLIAGLAGVFLTIGSVGAFTPNISSGKGFIALAVLIFGRWSPGGSLLAALLFGFAEAVESALSVVGSPIPPELLQMFPYLVTLVVVAGLVGRARPPAADGKPFIP
ncbi:MAG: ABC transporter permease [Actinobacteria bacterium]|nr:ABC transporter permease [Actinomycetota bacterium]